MRSQIWYLKQILFEICTIEEALLGEAAVETGLMTIIFSKQLNQFREVVSLKNSNESTLMINVGFNQIIESWC